MMCSSLSQVTLTSGLTVLGGSMFLMYDYATSTSSPTLLGTITIPSTLKSIGKGILLFYSFAQIPIFVLLLYLQSHLLSVIVIIQTLKRGVDHLLQFEDSYFIFLLVYISYHCYSNFNFTIMFSHIFLFIIIIRIFTYCY